MPAVSRFARTVRDICLVVMGVLTLYSTPPSVEDGLHTPLAIAWSATLLVAGVVCLVGAVLRHPLVEVTGCVLAAVGFATWSVAAVTQPNPNVTSWVIATLLVSGVAGQVYRVAEVIGTTRPVHWGAK